jgi:glutamate-1-semialdehyde 2,1-aminomutase/spore coat polysaccharide biosynthesis protein SpsF
MKLASSLDKIVVATTNLPEDEAVVAVAKEANVASMTGSEEDVLDRVYQAATGAEASVVVRVTGDCPLIDPAVIDQLVGYYVDHAKELDHVCLSPDWPEGFDTEALSFSVLQRAWQEAEKQYEREHVTPYVVMGGKFRTHRLPCPQDLSHLRLTVDEAVDYEVVRSIFEQLYPEHGHKFGLADILDLFNRRPDIFRPNMEIQRNEGFLKSLREERQVLRHDAKPVLRETNAVWSRAEPLIPAGTQTLSKGPTQYVQGVAPVYLQKGQGSRVWDVDGNEYIDYPMGLGCIILGHGYPRVNEAIQRQLQDGISFSLMHPLEVELAELLVSVMPWAEMVRFGKNGSDATTGAIRAARAYTGREKVFHCGYHGWHDWYIAGTTRNKGVPQGSIELQFEFPYNDLTALRELFDAHPAQVAAVIMEPYRTTPPDSGYLEGVKELAHANGAILIYDEVASGFRFRLGGINEIYGVTPDIGCFGKAMGNGMPISTIVGPSEVMKIFDELFYSFTFGGECLSLAASIATIEELRDNDVYTHTWEMGRRLMEGYNRMASDLKVQQCTQVVGLPPLTVPTFVDQSGIPSLLLKSLFQQEVLKRGILFGASHCVSYSHSEADIDMTLAAYYEALVVLKQALETGDVESLLDGPPISAVFRPQI